MSAAKLADVAQQAGAELLESVVAEFPCTLGQLENWKLDRAHRGDPTLNIAACWRLEGLIIFDVLEQSLQALTDRHEPLRTVFHERDGVLIQRVLLTAPLRLRVVDLTTQHEAERAAAANNLAREEAARPFDLARAPLLRATLVQLEPGVANLLVTTHYLVGDCWSNGILAKETAEIYAALRAGRTPDLPELEMQFGDYARWHEAWLKEGGADTAEAYWRRRLAGLREFHVPTDRAPPAQPARSGDVLGMSVPDALAAAAQRLARERGATFFMLGAATMAVLLHRWTGAREVVFGTQVAGRSDMELEGLIGPFVNTVPLRVDTSGNPPFTDLLDTVREIVGEALEHAAGPIERVLQDLPSTGQAAGRRKSLTAVNFLIQRAFTRDAAHDMFALRGAPNFSPGSRYDLNIFLVERPDGWRASCEYDPELFERARVDWLIRSFLAVLGAVAADPTCRLSSILLLRGPAAEGEATQPALLQTAPATLRAVPAGADEDGVRLAAIWAEVLRVKFLPANANFFELGGDSIRAVHLLTLTKSTFGRSISLGELFKGPTLAAMAARLRETTEAPSSQIVTMQADGTRPTIFAINNTGVFYTLSRLLGPDQPFVAVQALDPHVSPAVHPTGLQAIAARYVEAICRVQPHGPYVLIGLCVAGKVAFEVAQQLKAAGEAVPLLAVVDTWAPGHMHRKSPVQRLLTRWNVRLVRLRRQLQRMQEGTLSIRGFVVNRAAVRAVRNAAFEALRRRGTLSSVPPGVQNNLFVNYLDRAAETYEPQPYTGRVLVFYGPEQARGRFLDPSFGWRDLVNGQVDVVAVPANQYTQFEDHHQGLFQGEGAQVMAGHITAALD